MVKGRSLTVDLKRFVIVQRDPPDYHTDMNCGNVCRSVGELRRLIWTRHYSGAYGAEIRDGLLAQCGE